MDVDILDVLWYLLYENRCLECVLLGLEDLCDGVFSCGACGRDEEVLSLVLAAYQAKYRLRLSVSEEDFSLAIYDVLLKVVGYCFRSAEIFHCFRHFDTKFLAYAEEGVDGCTCREDNCGVVEYVDSLSAEFP